MIREVEEEIIYADRCIRELWRLFDSFLAHLKDHAEAEVVPGKIKTINKTISIECYGLSLNANPRVVRDERGDFAVECVFYTRDNEMENEIWRLYLTEDRHLKTSLVEDKPLCGFDNRYIARRICVPAMQAALNSIIFKPTI